ncbi:hypothetical protein ACFE04_019949 [Oxalis oulophora]
MSNNNNNYNDNNMVLITSSSSTTTTNERPLPPPQQNQIALDEKMVSSSSGAITKPTPGQQQHQQQQPVLNCPRCDSTNTKFCYYNNYSLSQPRHFCKACKRYWTRGGTLRNVPVGGGCRKNKRVKRPNGSSSTTTSLSQTQIDLSSSNHINPMFYGMQSNNNNIPSDLTLGSFSRLNSRNEFELGFSSNDHFTNPTKQIQAPDANSHLLSSFGLSSSMPTMASLLSSSFHQQKMVPNNFHAFQDLQLRGNNDAEGKVDSQGQGQGQIRMDWNQIEQIGLSDPSMYNWSACYDPTNMGSSVPSLI